MGTEHEKSISPERLSSLFQSRPIRPLPKRRLRERLSPEVADSIEYPPPNRNASPLFFYPSVVREEPAPTAARNYTVIQGAGYEDTVGLAAEAAESDEEELKRFANSKVVRRSQPEILNRVSVQATAKSASQAKGTNPQAPPSTASSVDGYDFFENTNNKKKRKIPTAGDSALNGVHALSDIGASVPSAPSQTNEHELAGTVSPSYYGTSALPGGSLGLSGPGRGRFGRPRNARSPLGTLVDGTNTLARAPKIKAPQWTDRSSTSEPLSPVRGSLPAVMASSSIQFADLPSSPPGDENCGIISSAIANAEKMSSDPGQENISLLHQPPATSKPRPASSQFTFTCDSQVPGTQWPGSDPAYPSMPTYPGPRARHAAGYPPANINGAPPNEHSPGNNPRSPTIPRKNKKERERRRLDRDLQQAAAARREEARIKRKTNPPKPEDDWKCYFCEYEDIFGEPPYALIRQFELKERKNRLKEENRRRLLEKAKAKSRKAKKSGKPDVKNNGAAAQPENLARGSQSHSHSTDEEFYQEGEDDYNDSLSPDDPPMLLSEESDYDSYDSVAMPEPFNHYDIGPDPSSCSDFPVPSQPVLAPPT